MAEFTDFEIEHDFTETQAWDGVQAPLVSIGDHQFEIVNVSQKPNKNNETMLAFECVVVDGDDAGAKLWHNINLNEVGYKRLKSLMVACGAGLGKFSASEMLGAKFLATVIHAEGKAVPDANGEVRAPKTFANLINERQLEAPEAKKAAAPKQPPVTQAKNGATAGRRA